MTAALVPWRPEPALGWAFMEDRSLGAKGERASEDLLASLAATQAFDNDVGFVESASKRQEWDAQGMQRVEHLGLTAVPADPSQPILPRGGWKKLLAALAVLASLPRAMDVREGLSVAYIRPLWNWAAPLVAPFPRTVPGQLLRAVLR